MSYWIQALVIVLVWLAVSITMPFLFPFFVFVLVVWGIAKALKIIDKFSSST